MKKHLIQFMTIGAMATALLASCNKNNNGTQGNVPKNGFRATIEQPTGGNGGSRTHINPDWVNDENTPVLWSADDQIKVANGEGTVMTCQIADGVDSQSGIFYASQQQEDFFVPNYVAAYPADKVSGFEGTTVTFNMPATQTYKANSFAEGAMPMVAYSDSHELPFKNVFGGICVPATGDGITVTSVVLTATDDNEHLSGTFSVNAQTGVITSAPTGGKTVTLDCGEGVVLDATTPTYFCIMVPQGALAGGFTMTFKNGNDELVTKTKGAITNGVGRNTIMVASVVSLDLRFSVSPTTKVYFSPGNLQYKAGVGFRFAEHQYDFIGAWDVTNWVDLFGWGVWGEGKNPLLASGNDSDYQWSTDFNSTLINNNETGWRTLSEDEWNYLFHLRTDAENKYGAATVCGIYGTLVLPDAWTMPSGLSFTSGMIAWNQNNYDATAWSAMEANGALFMPAAGDRFGTEVYGVQEYGNAWSSTPADPSANNRERAFYLAFQAFEFCVGGYPDYRTDGNAVRLVRE